MCTKADNFRVSCKFPLLPPPHRDFMPRGTGGGRGEWYTRRCVSVFSFPPMRPWSPEGRGRGEGDDIPYATLSPPVWFCILMGSGVSRFNISLIAWGAKSRDSILTPQLLQTEKSQKKIQTLSVRFPAWCLTAGPNRLIHRVKSRRVSWILAYCVKSRRVSLILAYCVKSRRVSWILAYCVKSRRMSWILAYCVKSRRMSLILAYCVKSRRMSLILAYWVKSRQLTSDFLLLAVG